MSFDLRPSLKFGVVPWQTQQHSLGYANWANNCGETSIEFCLLTLQYQYTDPQTLCQEVYGSPAPGPENIQNTIAWLQAHQAMPTITYTGAGYGSSDPVPVMAAAGASGYLSIPVFNCDSSGNIVQSYTGLFHNSPVVAYDGTTWTVLNVFYGTYVTFTDAQIRNAIYQGDTVQIQQSVYPPPPKETEVIPFDLPAGATKVVGGPTANSYFNMCNQSTTEQSASVVVYAVSPDGSTNYGSKTYTPTPNVPNVHPPSDAYDSVGNIPNVPANAAVSLMFVNQGAADVFVVIHGGM